MKNAFFASICKHLSSPRYETKPNTCVSDVKFSEKTSLTGQVYSQQLGVDGFQEHEFFGEDNRYGCFISKLCKTNMQLIITKYPSDSEFSYIFSAMLLCYMLPQLKYLPSNLNPIIMRGKSAEVTAAFRNIFCALKLDNKGISDRSSYQASFFQRAQTKIEQKALPKDPFFSFILDQLTSFLNTSSYIPDMKPQYTYRKSVII